MYNYVSDHFFLIDKIIHANNQRINSLSNQEEFMYHSNIISMCLCFFYYVLVIIVTDVVI